MTFDANHIRLMKEQATYDMNRQVTYKYPRECKSKGVRHLTPTEVLGYMAANDKDSYLKKIGKFEMEGC